MPSTGDSRQREFSGPEREALGDSGHALLGPDTLDIYLNEAAYWRNVPRQVWDYTLSGYQVLKNGSLTASTPSSAARSRLMKSPTSHKSSAALPPSSSLARRSTPTTPASKPIPITLAPKRNLKIRQPPKHQTVYRCYYWRGCALASLAIW